MTREILGNNFSFTRVIYLRVQIYIYIYVEQLAISLFFQAKLKCCLCRGDGFFCEMEIILQQ
jgi:hypothetical protein